MHTTFSVDTLVRLQEHRAAGNFTHTLVLLQGLVPVPKDMYNMLAAAKKLREENEEQEAFGVAILGLASVTEREEMKQVCEF